MNTNIAVCAYCLMENHVHLLIRDDADMLSVFMKKMGVSYSIYFNKKYERVGHLFQDRFRSEPVQDDAYFLTVYRYIIKNPEKAGICRYFNYPWSSFRFYGKRSFVDTSLIFNMLGGYEQYDKFLDADDNTACLDIDSEAPLLSDAKAKGIMKETLGIDNGFLIQSYDRIQRNAAINALLKAGLSERQIERLTGLPRRVIHSVIW